MSMEKVIAISLFALLGLIWWWIENKLFAPQRGQ